MKPDAVDLFVIGAGSGGVRAARMAAGLGAKVAIAENRHMGGTCVNVGCVPKKLFVYASHFREDFDAARGFGWSVGEARFDWSRLLAQKSREIERLQGIYSGLLEGSGVEILTGRARVLDPHAVAVGERRITAKRILIATGSRPSVPEFPGNEHVVTSDAMFFLEQLPRRALIVGGGYIAVEFAGILHGLGVQVALVHRGAKLLRGFDETIRDFLPQEMAKKGLKLRLNTVIERIEKAEDGYRAYTTEGETLAADLVLYATGRTPNTRELGLEAVGVALNEQGAVIVDEDYRTTIPSIHAIGDVTDRVNLTPVATAEAMALVNGLYGKRSTPVDYDTIPTAVFSQPNVATVGLTESLARARYPEIDVYQSIFTPMKHTLSGLGEKTMMKMVVNRQDGQVLGLHMVGPDAGEIIQGMAVALRAGATKQVFDSTLGIHPTAAEEFVTMRAPIG